MPHRLCTELGVLEGTDEIRAAGAKARILIEVTSVTNVNLQEKARRDWLANLT
ncbi:MAG: hypothetical protein M3Q07_27725 [Pseudobdellovibrionaceae bacterium]|nr:hypothetical protein [Pseudobdellovibrionaceae bacterium]